MFLIIEYERDEDGADCQKFKKVTLVPPLDVFID